MIILTAIDNSNGLLFNHRRVSKDRVLRERILDISSSSRLLMDEFSSKQFKEALLSSVIIRDDFMDAAARGDYVFVEDKHISAYADKIEAIYLFKWNRDYPSDFKLDFVPSEETGFKLITTEDFVGSSHEKITMEVWEKSGAVRAEEE